MQTLVVVSDIHHAGPLERGRTRFESRSIANPLLRALAQTYRGLIWLRDPLAHPRRLERFLAAAGQPDLVVANGDYAVDSAFVGVADQGAFQSVHECLERLRGRFGQRFHPVMGDHELGKMNLFGGAGGLRLESYRRAAGELGLRPFWTREAGHYLLMGIASPLITLPIYAPETLPGEREAWEELARGHWSEIRGAFEALRSGQRVLLFLHDPTALPFLAREPAVRRRLGQIERAVIGHLHSNFTLAGARLLAGLPEIGFLGNTVRRYSAALRRARAWKLFRLVLCPSLTGIQLLKDGGFLRIRFDPEGRAGLSVETVRLPWESGAGN